MQLVIFGIPIHFCQHEAIMLLTAVGTLPLIGAWLRSKLMARHKKAGCEHGPGEKH